jgi:hypothetical protein
MASTISSSAIALLIAAFPALALGHAYLAYPESRNLVAHLEEGFNCAHCLQSGGPDAVKAKANGIWPTRLAPGSHGLCGNPWQHEEEANFENQRFMQPTEVKATLTTGGFVDILVAVNAHHRGHFEFRICNQVLSPENFASEAEGQACLDQFVLERADLPNDCTVNDERDNCVPLDPKHPERWYLPPAKGDVQKAGEDWSDEMVDTSRLPAATELRSIRYKVPAGLSCQRCTMQWYWSSANTCLYDADYLSYFRDLHQKGWSEVETWAPHVLQSWATADNTVCSSTRFGEEFWNCADISVVASGAPMQPTPNPPIQQETPMPTAAVTPEHSSQPEPEPEPEPAPATPAPQHSGESEACGSVWEQCGGVHWTGATCCEGDNFCHRQDQWYSQCLPPSQSLLQGANAQSGPRRLKIHRRHANDQILFQQGSALSHDESEL